MSRFTSRAARLGVATALAAGITAVGAGTASAATCNYERNTDAVVGVGSFHLGTADGECWWLEPGMGLEGQGNKPNTISLGHVELPDGGWLIGLVHDPFDIWSVSENWYN